MVLHPADQTLTSRDLRAPSVGIELRFQVSPLKLVCNPKAEQYTAECTDGHTEVYCVESVEVLPGTVTTRRDLNPH